MNTFAEDFVKDLLNIVFDYNLKNLNFDIKNQVSIDLGDMDNGVAYQVTSTKTTPKIQTTIDKFIEFQLYGTYPQLYVFILQDKQKSYPQFDTRGFFTFNSQTHILDFKHLLAIIKTLETDKLRKVNALIQEELRTGNREARLIDKGTSSSLRQLTERWS